MNPVVAKSKEVRFDIIMGVPSIKFCTTLLVLSLLISLLSQSRTEAVPTYSDHSCLNAPSFTVNTSYQSNLNQLLAYLSSNATRNIEFYNPTASAMGSAALCQYGLRPLHLPWRHVRRCLPRLRCRCNNRHSNTLFIPLYLFQHGY